MPETGNKRTGRKEVGHLATYLGGEPDVLLAREVDAYHRLSLADPQIKGQLSTGIASDGGGLYVSVVFDFGDMLAPCLKLPVGLAVNVSQLDATLLAIYRMPEKLWKQRIKRIAALKTLGQAAPAELEDRQPIKALSRTAGAYAEVSPSYVCARPTTFLMLQGSIWRGELKARATAAFNPKLKSDDELQIVVGADFEVGAEFRTLKLRDPAPRRYPSGGFSQDLSDDVNAAVQVNLKKLARAYLDAVSWFGRHQKVEGLVREQLANAVAAGINRGMAEEKIDDPRGGDRDSQPVVFSVDGFFKRFSRPRSTKALKAALLKVAEDVHKIKGLTDAEKQQFRTRVYHLVFSLTAAKMLKDEKKALKRSAENKAFFGMPLSKEEKEALTGRVSFRGRPLNLIDAVSYAGEIGAGAIAQGKATQGGAGVDVSLSGRARAHASRTSYRFQVCSDESADPIVMTQDTLIQRVQVTGEVALKAGGLEPPQNDPLGPYEQGSALLSGELKYNTMAYQSAVVYWKYPDGTDVKSMDVKALPNGSGINFGLSMSSSRFLHWVQQRRHIDGGTDKGLKLDRKAQATELQLFSSLKVPKEALSAFARDCDLVAADFKPTNMLKVSTIVIESSYAFKRPTALPMTERSAPKASADRTPTVEPDDLFKLPEIDTFEPKQYLIDRSSNRDPFRLDSIRLRVLVGGTTERTERMFQLGFTVVVGVTVGLDTIENAGTESAIDLYLWRAGDAPDTERKPAGAKRWKSADWPPDIASELGVPPVAFVNQ